MKVKPIKIISDVSCRDIPLQPFENITPDEKGDFNKKVLANGCNTHCVLKLQDIYDVLSFGDICKLIAMVCRIQSFRANHGKNNKAEYYICNTDEPYADDANKVILDFYLGNPKS